MKGFLLAVAVLALGCGGTERTRRTFPLEVTGQSAGIVTDSGWAISVTQAQVSLSTARFFAGKVLLGVAPARLDVWRLLFPVAHAHPGHYQQGEALGECLTGAQVDLLGPATVWCPSAQAVTGEYGSLQLGLAAPGLTVRGTALKQDRTVAFEAEYLPPRALEGIAFDRAVDAAPGRVRVTVDLRVVLGRIDFDRAGASTAPLDVTSQAFNGLVRGVTDTSAYRVEWLP